MRIKGTANISLDDYDKLKNLQEDIDTLDKRFRKSMKEMQVFLSFLASRTDITDFVNEFNRQSTTSIITIDSGVAKIKDKNETKD